MRPWMRLLPLMLVVSAWSFSKPVVASDVTVSVANFSFTPIEATIAVGEKVTWTWASGTHSVVQDFTNEVWCASRTAPAANCEKTFPTEGTFNYHCGVHPATMKAKVVVGVPVAVTIASPAAGSDVQGTFTVSGTATHGSGVSLVEARMDAQPFQAAAGTTSWSISFDSRSLTNGLHTVDVRASASSGAAGAAKITVNVANPPTVDFRVGSFTGRNGLAGSTQLTLQAANDGNSGASSTALFEYFLEGSWHTIGSQSLMIAAQSSQTVFQTWSDPTLVGRFDVRVRVDPGEAVTELNEANNAAQASASFWTDQVDGLDLDDLF